MRMNFPKKKKLAYIEGHLSIFINLILFGLKFLVGRKVGSVAMVADAWHTLSDCLTSLIVVVGFWVASRPADDRHAFGHGRAESVASVIIGTLLAVVGFNFLYESGYRLIHKQGMAFSQVALLIFLISAVVKEALAQFSFWAGKKTGSSSLKADAWHHRSDAIASLLIVLGIAFSQKFWWVDGLLGIGVSFLILKVSYEIIRGSASYLLGESPSQEKIDRVSSLVQGEFPELGGLHHLHVHHYGEHHEVTAHVVVPGSMTVDEAHDIASRVEQIVRKEFNGDVTIHVEPEKSKEEDRN